MTCHALPKIGWFDVHKPSPIALLNPTFQGKTHDAVSFPYPNHFAADLFLFVFGKPDFLHRQLFDSYG